MRPYADNVKYLQDEALKRVLVFDGPRGTMIQQRQLSEEEFRGERFKDYPTSLKGNNDLLNITQPQIVEEIFSEYLDAGSDFVGTNTFNSTSISQADYGLEEICYELNFEGAKIARRAADAATQKTPDKPRFVVGAMGPMSKTLSISPDVNDPGYRAVTFDEVKAAYKEEAQGLVDGGVDFLAVETVFDTLNCKAAIVAIDEVREEKGIDISIMVSGTITDLSGRTLSGQTVEAFWNSIRHAKPFSVGLNCALGAEEMRPHIVEFARIADCLICTYPNAGLPNEFGEYDQTPEIMAEFLGEWAESGLVNIVGGCCGSTPAHVKAIAEAVADAAPRERKSQIVTTRLAGLEPLALPQ